ncbi:MAG: carboxypeptidase regulatory-like domain-containing protein [Bryobacteraceae bacterium]|jgi:hypothetical protein
MFSQRVFRVVLLAALFALCLTAQTGNGMVQGTVKDSSGAAIPGATVTLVNTATMVETSTKTNDVGLFVFPPVVPGNYTIAAQSAGMETWRGSFILPAGQTREVSPVLKVGAVTTQVTVAGEVAPLVPTTDATLSRDLERTRIEQLPSDGRSVQQLAQVSTPGMYAGIDGATNGTPGSLNPIDTGLRDAVELYQDGAVKRNRDVGDWAGRMPGVDSVDEMHVEISMSSAQFDRPASVILSTKGGTNNLHGTAFETNRTSGVGVARRRQDFFATGKPPHLVRNEYGVSVGGPVYIPKVYNGKNKTFFFSSFEIFSLRSQSTLQTSMPTMAQRNGDYSDGLLDSQGRTTLIYDPLSTGPAPTWTRTPFPNNVMPASSISPNAKYLYSIMPVPNQPTVNPNIGNNYFGVSETDTDDKMSTSRIDHRFGERDQIFGRFSRDFDNNIYTQGTPTITPHQTSLDEVYNYYGDNNAVGTWTHSFSPSFVSATKVSWSHEFKFTGSPTDPKIGNVTDYLGEPNPQNYTLTAYQGSGQGFGTSFTVQQARQNTSNIWMLDEDLTRQYGRHQLQFGGRAHIEMLNVLIDQPTASVGYDNLATALYDPTSGSAYSAKPFTGFNGAAFFLGDVGSLQVTTKRPPWDLVYKEYAAYIQDNWKASSRLTLNFGLRYENQPAMAISGNFNLGFDQNTDSMVLGRSLSDMYQAQMTTPVVIAGMQNIGVKFETPQQAGLPAGLIYGNPLMFFPRLGVAYRLGDNVKPFMLRGGWGVYDSQTALRTWDTSLGNGMPYSYPVKYSVSNQSLVGLIPAADGLPNYELRTVPQMVAGVNTRHILDNPAFTTITPGCCSVGYFDPHQKVVRDQEWNFSIGHEFFQGIVVTASYTGTHGANLPSNNNFNSAPNDYVWYANTGGQLKPTGLYASTGENPYDQKTYGSINEYLTRGHSNAESATIEVQRRFSHGYGFQWYYELTNAFTETTLTGNGGGTSVAPLQDFLTSANLPTDFDQRNQFLNYTRDSAIPHQFMQWNWVADLPIGRGELLASHAGKVLNGIIGGWQLAGTGSYKSRYWSLDTSNYGLIQQMQEYGVKEFPIKNCTGGTCLPGYLAANGYISVPTINRTNAAGQCTGICGIPSTYVPYSLPLITYGQTALPANAPSNTVLSTYWETQNVWFKLQDGSNVRTTINTNLPALRNQSVAGPWQFGLNASLFKVFDVTERVKLRFNADFFNVLNNPGLGTPGSNGIISVQSSTNGARDLQLTLRLSW